MGPAATAGNTSTTNHRYGFMEEHKMDDVMDSSFSFVPSCSTTTNTGTTTGTTTGTFPSSSSLSLNPIINTALLPNRFDVGYDKKYHQDPLQMAAAAAAASVMSDDTNNNYSNAMEM
jgi:hypothetical protein